MNGLSGEVTRENERVKVVKAPTHDVTKIEITFHATSSQFIRERPFRGIFNGSKCPGKLVFSPEVDKLGLLKVLLGHRAVASILLKGSKRAK